MPGIAHRFTTTNNNNNNRQVGSTIKNIASKGGLILLSALIIIPVVSASGDGESLIREFGSVTAAVAGGFAAVGSEAFFGETKEEECDEFNQMPPEIQHHMSMETRNRNRVFGSTKPRQQIGMNDGMNSPDQSPDKKRITLGTPGKLFKSTTRNLFGSRGSSRNSADSGGSRGSNADHSDDDNEVQLKEGDYIFEHVCSIQDNTIADTSDDVNDPDEVVDELLYEWELETSIDDDTTDDNVDDDAKVESPKIIKVDNTADFARGELQSLYNTLRDTALALA